MTFVVWTAIGIAIGAVVLHTALGLWRPLDRTSLAFACIMASVAAFLYLQVEVYRATAVHAVVEAKQRQVTIVNVCFACIFIFIPAYSRVRIPRLVMAACWGVLAIMFAANFVAPYGLWFSGEPRLVASHLAGESYTIVIASPMGAPQLAYALFATSLVIGALACAVVMFRRGERQRAVTLAIALALVLGHGVIDIIRDNVGGTWPYVAEYGVVAWGLIMSVQLARDFRSQARGLATAITHVEMHAQRLTAMLDALHALENNMRIPLDALETGVVTLARGTETKDAQLRRIERAITRLRELERSMPDTSARRIGAF